MFGKFLFFGRLGHSNFNDGNGSNTPGRRHILFPLRSNLRGRRYRLTFVQPVNVAGVETPSPGQLMGLELWGFDFQLFPIFSTRFQLNILASGKFVLIFMVNFASANN